MKKQFYSKISFIFFALAISLTGCNYESSDRYALRLQNMLYDGQVHTVLNMNKITVNDYFDKKELAEHDKKYFSYASGSAVVANESWRSGARLGFDDVLFFIDDKGNTTTVSHRLLREGRANGLHYAFNSSDSSDIVISIPLMQIPNPGRLKTIVFWPVSIYSYSTSGSFYRTTVSSLASNGYFVPVKVVPAGANQWDVIPLSQEYQTLALGAPARGADFSYTKQDIVNAIKLAQVKAAKEPQKTAKEKNNNEF